MRIDGKNQFDPMLLLAPGPVVIDVRIDPDVTMPKVDRVAVMATRPKTVPATTPNIEPSTPPRLRVVN
jgi:hypothetical protein